MRESRMPYLSDDCIHRAQKDILTLPELIRRAARRIRGWGEPRCM